MKPPKNRNQTQKASKTAPKTKANPLWGGQFDSGPDALMAAINQSIDVDQRFYRQDIAGSKAHAAMLAKQGIITAKENAAIQKGLDQILLEIDAGKFPFRAELEDIHMNIEVRLKEIIGDAAGRLHTARSRNDQVATDFRLWVRDAAIAMDAVLKQLQTALIERAEQSSDAVIPGFTHLQVAQPVTLGHHLLAYVEMFGRDRGRFADCLTRLNESPLGAAALAGTSFPIDRFATAKALGFDRPMSNSLDAVSSRDFALEFLAACSICATHISRFAEECVIWSSAQFNFIRFSDRFSSGSSIMPQKRNPDAAELLRAKVGCINGHLVALLTVMKGLTLAYNKDMQEDKEQVFAAFDQLELSVAVMTGMVRDFSVHGDVLRVAAAEGYSTATDLADWLVRKLNMPFRDAHHITASIVKVAAQKKLYLTELPLAEMQKIHPKITKDVFGVLSVEDSVKSRVSFGGTSPKRVREAIKAARKKYL
jgi:argininosuccinate lyase